MNNPKISDIVMTDIIRNKNKRTTEKFYIQIIDCKIYCDKLKKLNE